MAKRQLRSRRACQCFNSTLPFSSALLFLSFILPSSTFAQLQLPRQIQPSTINPTTLATSTAPSFSSSAVLSSTTPTSTPPSTPTLANLPIATTTDPTISPGATHVFNYYFLIVAVAAILFCICILLIGRRKKRKAAVHRSNSQHALARDVEGWRERFGMGGPSRNYTGFGFGFGLGGNNRGRDGGEEGLDELGEAPPPYTGSKPPSLRSIERRRSSADIARTQDEAMELSRLSGDGHQQRDVPKEPPGYHEHSVRVSGDGSGDITDITRPAIAITASDRFGSMRRLLSNSRSSSQA